MSIHAIRADLSNLPFYVDFIVNTANPRPKVGNGLDKAIFMKAGPQMLEERKQIGDIAPGDIAITNAYGLKAKQVIHAVSVAWTDGFHDETLYLQKCYRKALAAAVDYMQNHVLLSVSIAMPLIGTGIYQIPFEISLAAAMSESMQCVLQHNVEIFLVAFSEASVSAMRKVLPVEEHLTYIKAIVSRCRKDTFTSMRCSILTVRCSSGCTGSLAMQKRSSTALTTEPASSICRCT